MKTTYRGHEIDVRREQSMGGDSNLYYSIFRVSDGYECTSGFTIDTSTPAEFTAHMKARIDAELTEADPWGEHADDDALGVKAWQPCPSCHTHDACRASGCAEKDLEVTERVWGNAGVMVPHECKRHADCIGRCMVCGEDVPAGVPGTFNDQGEKR